MGIKISFFNGATSKSAWDPESPAFIDDWKPENRIVRCESVQVTYCQHLRLFGVVGDDGRKADVVEIWADDDLFVFDGVYYGDFNITCEEN